MRPILGKEIDTLPIQSKVSNKQLECSVSQFFQMWENDQSFVKATGLKLQRTNNSSIVKDYEKGFTRKVTTKDGFVVEEKFTVFDHRNDGDSGSSGEICFYGTKATLFGLIPVATAFAERLVLKANNNNIEGGCVLEWQVAAELNWFGKLFLTSIVQAANDKMVQEFPTKMEQVALRF